MFRMNIKLKEGKNVLPPLTQPYLSTLATQNIQRLVLDNITDKEWTKILLKV